MHKRLIAFGLVGVLVTAHGIVLAENDLAGADEVVAKVRMAVALIEDKGDAALAIIADPSAGYIWKDTYVFVVNCDADRVMANPAFPERVGGDIKQHTDYAGRRYGLDLCRAAGDPAGGWVEYVWLKPGGETPQVKSSFVMPVPGAPYQVGAGIYDESTAATDTGR